MATRDWNDVLNAANENAQAWQDAYYQERRKFFALLRRYQADRNELQARIAELEAERDTLKDKIDDLEFEVITLTTDVRSVEADAAFHQERWEEVEDQLVRAEEERNEWFSKYQNLKTRTDNYDFLVYKTREQTEEIYRLVREINKLGG